MDDHVFVFVQAFVLLSTILGGAIFRRRTYCNNNLDMYPREGEMQILLSSFASIKTRSVNLRLSGGSRFASRAWCPWRVTTRQLFDDKKGGDGGTWHGTEARMTHIDA